MRRCGNFGGAEEPALAQPFAQQCERMPPQRERQRPVVGDDVLTLGRRGEIGISFGEGAAREERR